MANEGELCKLEKRGAVYILTLLGHGEHRINPPLVEAMLTCLKTLKETLIPSSSSPSSSVLITTSEGKFFSNGLDLSYPSFPMVGVCFQKLLEAYMNLPMPTIAAVCGHAAAGGFILALAHDHILMRRDRGFLYMSEIDVSILIPPGVMNIVRYKMGPKAFKDAVLCGKKHTADVALSLGIVDSVYDDSEKTVQAASELAKELVSRKWKGNFYRDMREAMYPDVFREFNRSSSSSLSRPVSSSSSCSSLSSTSKL